jgi:alkylation response protein AidB-like acyl-CoA dehydrogenase
VQLTYTDAQEDLRERLHRYLADLMTPELLDELEAEVHGGPCYRRTIRQMGADGWLGVGWPQEYGGHGLGAVEQYIFFDEAQRARAPVPFMALNTVGPTLMDRGTDEQKERYLPAILRGEIDFAIGYTEPDAGTDLAAMRTRAERTPDGYVVNGAKVFTSRGGTSDYVWLAARTDPGSKRHRGISILILDTKSPGFRAAETRTIAGYSTFSTFYDDVLVPLENLVGHEHEGWRLLTTQLNHERMALAAFGGLAHRLLDDVRAWAGEGDAAGPPAIERPWVREHLARCHALLAPMRLMNLRMAWQVERGTLRSADASAVKVYGTTTVIEVYRLLMEVVGEAGTSRSGRAQLLHGDLEWAYRRSVINTFGGGTNEIQREIVATGGLDMPRVPR